MTHPEDGGGPAGPSEGPVEDNATQHEQLPVFRLFFFYLPETSMLRRFRFQLVVISRFLSEIGQEGIFYGALVQTAVDGTAFQASMIGAAKVLPGATLGIFGGAVADALPRRVGLGLGYVLQAALVVTVPIVFGTGFGVLVFLVLGVSMLNQVIGPSEKSVIPLVSKHEEISSAAATLALTDSIATGIGTAAVAPVVLVTFGVRPLFFVCSAFLIFAAVRIFALPIRKNVSVKQALERLNLSEMDLGFSTALRWLMGWPAILTILIVGMLVTVLSSITETLAPSYVGDVLGADPAKSVYVFAPAGFGALVALGIAPKVVDTLGERWGAAIAVLVMSLSLFVLAFMDTLAPILAPVSPMNAVRLVGLEPTDPLLGASLVSMFTGFAVSMSSISVQTYITRRVPMLRQGRVFGLQSMLASAAALIPMLLLGFLADLLSIETIMFFAPGVVLLMVYGLLVFASRLMGVEPMSRGQVLESFWNEPESATTEAAHPEDG